MPVSGIVDIEEHQKFEIDIVKNNVKFAEVRPLLLHNSKQSEANNELCLKCYN